MKGPKTMAHGLVEGSLNSPLGKAQRELFPGAQAKPLHHERSPAASLSPIPAPHPWQTWAANAHSAPVSASQGAQLTHLPAHRGLCLTYPASWEVWPSCTYGEDSVWKKQYGARLQEKWFVLQITRPIATHAGWLLHSAATALLPAGVCLCHGAESYQNPALGRPAHPAFPAPENIHIMALPGRQTSESLH